VNIIACHDSQRGFRVFRNIHTIGTKPEFAPICRYSPAAVLACNCITRARSGDRPTSLYPTIPTLPSCEL
jgi:hypothetical protein